MIKVAFYDTKPYDRESFSQASDGIEFVFHEFRLGPDSAVTACGCQAVCVFVNDDLGSETLEILKKNGIDMVALRCAGFNNADLEKAKELGIRLVRVPAYSPYAVAEHAVALLLTLNRKIHKAHRRVREQDFSLHGLVGFDLHGKTVAVIGTGKIGRIFAEIMRGFRTEVLAYDLYPNWEWAAEHGISYVEKEEAFRKADIISLHTPLTEETHYLINKEALAQCKKGVFLINTSRGKLIDTTALIDGLKSRKLGGVGLDVYEVEEGVFFEDLSLEILSDDELSRLITFPNVIVTSHQAFLTHEALSEIARVTTVNLRKFSAGEAYLEGTQLC